MREAAHALKGTAGAVGAGELADRAALVESHCRQGTCDQTGALDLVAQAGKHLMQLQSTRTADHSASPEGDIAEALSRLREELTAHDWVDPHESVDLVTRLTALLPRSDAPERLSTGLLSLDYAEALAALEAVEREVRGSSER